mmetsp:Transcript_9464/g.15736  ORF Transcript_9464/g.15736 Transcript_9464/m.15736 type:complete len:229 (+) Transcript_9464:458-1144(+)
MIFLLLGLLEGFRGIGRLRVIVFLFLDGTSTRSRVLPLRGMGFLEDLREIGRLLVNSNEAVLPGDERPRIRLCMTFPATHDNGLVINDNGLIIVILHGNISTFFMSCLVILHGDGLTGVKLDVLFRDANVNNLITIELHREFSAAAARAHDRGSLGFVNHRAVWSKRQISLLVHVETATTLLELDSIGIDFLLNPVVDALHLCALATFEGNWTMGGKASKLALLQAQS